MQKIAVGWSSHLPVLHRVMDRINGPVLELGIGFYSTPFLHWLCQDKGLLLESYESDEAYYNTFSNTRRRSWSFKNDNHKITLVKNWDEIDIDNKRWGLVFIDHTEERRAKDAIRVANSADYVILHDSQDNHYDYESVYKHFKYRKDFNQFSPRTTILSNFKELNDL